MVRAGFEGGGGVGLRGGRPEGKSADTKKLAPGNNFPVASLLTGDEINIKAR